MNNIGTIVDGGSAFIAVSVAVSASLLLPLPLLPLCGTAGHGLSAGKYL